MYAAVARTVKEQKVLVTDFTDIIFRKNSVRGVNLEEPLDYDKAMDVARSVLAKHGHSTIGNFFSLSSEGSLGGTTTPSSTRVGSTTTQERAMRACVETRRCG